MKFCKTIHCFKLLPLCWELFRFKEEKENKNREA